MDIAALAVELTTDPLVRGYAAKTNQQCADDLNTKYRTRERATISGADIYNAIVPAEWGALTNAQKEIVRDIFHLGDAIDVRTGTNVRSQLLTVFGPATVTRTNLAAKVQESISRAEELNLGTVGDGHVASARGT